MVRIINIMDRVARRNDTYMDRAARRRDIYIGSDCAPQRYDTWVVGACRSLYTPSKRSRL